jgi:endonuclease III
MCSICALLLSEHTSSWYSSSIHKICHERNYTFARHPVSQECLQNEVSQTGKSLHVHGRLRFKNSSVVI